MTETDKGELGRPPRRLYCLASGRRDLNSAVGLAWPLCVLAVPLEDIVMFLKYCGTMNKDLGSCFKV